MIEDARVVFESRNRGHCSDRALVLAASQIPHEVIHDANSSALIVPAEFSAKAVEQLRLYDEENPPLAVKPRPKIHYQNPVPGIVAYVLALCFVGWLAGISAFGENWLQAGRVDGALIRAGEWWRTLTALTLHADLSHLGGNLIFGGLFGLFAGRLLGSGVAWFSIVTAAAMGNVLNTLLLESSHRSIGASTAVFAALGMVAGYVWKAKLMSQERWVYRMGPIVGGLALLMYTGTGDENTDIGAHLMGFVCGFATGMVLTLLDKIIRDIRWQLMAGACSVLIVSAAWLIALRS